MKAPTINAPPNQHPKKHTSTKLSIAQQKALIAQARTLPEQPGVYRFLNEIGYPLYIGKSINLKQRVLSHLYAAKRCPKECKLAQSSHRIEAQVTPGELSALLLESQLIKQELPLFNRRLRRTKNLLSWHFMEDDEGYLSPHITTAHWPPNQQGHYLGLYTSRAHAKQHLVQLSNDHLLCKKRLKLEKTSRACFSYQLKKCKGACTGIERTEQYNHRLLTIVTHDWLTPWPFSGAVAVIENTAPEMLHIIHEWFYLGSVTTGTQLKNPPLNEKKMLLNRDDYRILLKWILNPPASISIEPYSLMIP